MKKKIILVVDADADVASVVLEVASQTGHGVRLAKTSRDAFKVLKDEIEYIDIAIIDLDPGAHGMALLEAISGREECSSVVVLTALEETYMEPIAERHGAAACLGKPISVEKLKSTIGQVPRRPPLLLTLGDICVPLRRKYRSVVALRALQLQTRSEMQDRY